MLHLASNLQIARLTNFSSAKNVSLVDCFNMVHCIVI